MPRKSRIDAPWALHHIIGRGIDRRKIFSDKMDYNDFLSRLGAIVSETKTSCYAWALLTKPNSAGTDIKPDPASRQSGRQKGERFGEVPVVFVL